MKLLVVCLCCALCGAVPGTWSGEARPKFQVSRRHAKNSLKNSRSIDPNDAFALPDGFLVGAGLSACQAEGAWNEGGKSESVLDSVVHVSDSGLFPNNSDVSADHYHRYEDDLALARRMKLTSFRFSISWARVLPTGDSSNPNMEGVDFYRKYIDTVLSNGMEPLVTMYHFDQPFSLEKQLGGWASPEMVDKFVEYADFLFDTFGKKVKYWVTINEPNNYCVYFPGMLTSLGLTPPDDKGPYRCMHHMNLAHARAYRLYKEKYYDAQQGQVGASVLVWPAEPASTRSEDVLASEAFLQLFSGTVLHPLVFGDYSDATRYLVDRQNAERGLTESRLPFFNETEKQLLQGGTADFIALNVYNRYTVTYRHNTTGGNNMPRLLRAIEDDLPFVEMSATGEYDETGSDEYVMHDALLWTWNSYHVPIAVTENGYADIQSLGVKDTVRAAFHSTNLRSLLLAMKQYDVKVLGYYAWALLDVFEFTAGYSRNFGLIQVDYSTGSLNRTLKDSASFFRGVMETRRVRYVQPPASSGPTSSTPPPVMLCFALVTLILCALNQH